MEEVLELTIERHGGKPEWPTRDRELQGLPMPVAVWG
jgi:hypothetical protein